MRKLLALLPLLLLLGCNVSFSYGCHDKPQPKPLLPVCDQDPNYTGPCIPAR